MSFFDPERPDRVKICGVTNAADAAAAMAAGAAALGLNFFPGSRRHLGLAENREWIARLAGQVTRIAVVVNPPADLLASLRRAGCFEAIQFHGDEDPSFCAAAGFSTWIRAVRVRDAASLATALDYETPYLLLDGWSEGSYGGTGRRPDWELAGAFVAANPGRKVILAGGLTPENAASAVAAVRPFAVDVAGGVEGADPRRKDALRIRQFIEAVRAASAVALPRL